MANPDGPEAAEWVAREIERLRGLSFDDLARLEGEPEHRPLFTRAGTALMLETQVFWDDREKMNLRVIVDVWNPARRVSIGSIAKDDFIRAPDGSFVGEEVRSGHISQRWRRGLVCRPSQVTVGGRSGLQRRYSRSISR
jgi:hypothetical protein